MKFLHIAIIASCNRRCLYCKQAIEGNLYDIDYPADGYKANQITNEGLLKWLDACFNPDEWYVCITGGEPGMYREIETLIPALNERGFKGHIETNGSLPIPESKNFKRLATWHMGAEFPEYYDIIRVIKNPHEDYLSKIAYCKEKGIPCDTIGYGGPEGGHYQMNFKDPHGFEDYIHISPDGIAKRCQQGAYDKKNSIFNMPSLSSLGHKDVCPWCSTCTDNAKMMGFIEKHFGGGGQ